MQLVGALQIAQGLAGQCEIVYRGQGVGVVVAQDPPEAGQGLLVEVVGALEIAEGSTQFGEVVHGLQGVGVVIAQDTPAGNQGLL